MRVSWKDPPLSTMRRWTTSISELEHRVAALVRPFSLLMLRVSLGVVFVWFGALKVANVTPVGALVVDRHSG
jgi:putative oxidoreductase